MAFNLASEGCSMAHCDVRLSDIANMNVPRGQGTAIKFHDDDPVQSGSNAGLGVASNGTVVAATYQSGNTLVVYDFNGTITFSSSRLNGTAWKSAPMISTFGEVIAADDTRIIRWNANPDVNGNESIQWNVEHFGNGAPFSPVLTSNDRIVIVTENGNVKVHGTFAGIQTGSLALGFLVKNTPAVNGARIYVVGNAGTSGPGRLRAIDIPNFGAPTIAWSYDLAETGGASPLFWNNSIYFDGRLEVNDPWQILKADDLGSTASLTSIYTPQNPNSWVPASMAQDVRTHPVHGNSIWFFQIGGQLTRISTSGAFIEDISNIVLGGVPASAMTMCGTGASPVILVRAGFAENAGVVAMYLNTNTRLWKVGGIDTLGQFGILQRGAQFRVACTARSTNLYLLG